MDINVVREFKNERPDAISLIDAHLSTHGSVLKPLLQNVLRNPSDPKFRSFRSGNPKIAAAFSASEVLPALGYQAVHGAKTMGDWLRLAGFRTTDRDGESYWTLPEEVSVVAVDEVLSDLRREEDLLAKIRNQLDILARSTVSRGAGAPKHVHSHGARDEDPRRVELLAQIERERRERRDSVSQQQHLEQEGRAQSEADFEEGAKVLREVQMVLHKTGRLRNSSFGAQSMTVRKMTNGRRVYQCGDTRCENGVDGRWGYEVHWHQRTGNLLYSFVAHISDDCSTVYHVGDEYGYQYCNLPGETNFGKTVLLNIKKWNHTTLSVEDISHHCKPSTCCIYCQRSFTNDLWL